MQEVSLALLGYHMLAIIWTTYSVFWRPIVYRIPATAALKGTVA